MSEPKMCPDCGGRPSVFPYGDPSKHANTVRKSWGVECPYTSCTTNPRTLGHRDADSAIAGWNALVANLAAGDAP